MENDTETVDVGAPVSEQQLATEASDTFQFKCLIAHQDYVRVFATKTKMTNRKARDFAGEISKCPVLEDLSISGNDRGFLREFAGGLGVCPELKHLDLSKNNIEDNDMDSLWQVIQKCPKLARLTLLDNAVAPEALETRLRQVGHTELKDLDLGCRKSARTGP
jgi:hypothetical protein